jgi:hypothetical protein
MLEIYNNIINIDIRLNRGIFKKTNFHEIARVNVTLK